MRFLLIALLLFPLPAFAQMKYVLQYQDQFGRWHRYQEKRNEGDASGLSRDERKQLANASESWMEMVA